MRLVKPVSLVLVFLLLLILTTCGIDEIFYLPPVTQVTMQFTTNAEIVLPSIPSAYYYVDKFTIFYRIYLSNADLINVVTSSDRININQQLENDFNYFNNNYINPVNAAPPLKSSFESRHYYELLTFDSVLDTTPGTGSRIINIGFDAEQRMHIQAQTFPVSNHIIYRNNNAGFLLVPNNLFKYQSEILSYGENTGPGKVNNGDVINDIRYASYNEIYVSMYIVTEGITNLMQSFSRPKHIGVFRLR